MPLCCRFPLNLAGFWTVQGLWAWIVLLPVTAAQVRLQDLLRGVT